LEIEVSCDILGAKVFLPLCSFLLLLTHNFFLFFFFGISGRRKTTISGVCAGDGMGSSVAGTWLGWGSGDWIVWRAAADFV